MGLDRAALIDAAVEEVKREFATMQKTKLSSSQAKLHAFKMATPEAMAQGRASLKFERMVKLAEKKILVARRQATVQTTSSMAEALATELLHKPGTILSEEEIARVYQETRCSELLPTPNCNNPAARFHRTPDGSCNNVNNTTWGATNTPLSRLIPSRYDDGVSRPRGFLQNQGFSLFSGDVFSPPNPSPRIASLGIIEDRIINDSAHTHILMQWGQFMDHDLAAVPEHEECPHGCNISEEDEGRCYPFPVPADDEGVMVTRTSPTERGCHEFHRSLGACPPADARKVPVREQVNTLTHFLDGSMVFGSSARILQDLRGDDGLLRVGPPANVGSRRPLLPDVSDEHVENHDIACPNRNPECFLAGDFRVNEQSALTVMHTLWVREHNRIAAAIKQSNPSFDSNKVFLTTREIVAAEIAKITYQDYLPILLGDDYATLIGDYRGYDSTVKPVIPNAFATAAYRFGHSQIQPFFERLDENLQSISAGPLSLQDAFFDTSHVREFGTDAILRGLLAKQARQVDEFLNSILTNTLFADSVDTPGLDLAALNIQRGRDHGLPKYLTWKQWAEKRCLITSEFRSSLTEIRLIQTYGSLDNVDLFVGGLAEEPLPNGLVGAVFGCIFSQAFNAVRSGDRFYYENSGETALFSPEQREQIGKASLSRVICDNTDIMKVQRNAFLADQERVPCSQLPSVDLSAWAPQILPELCFVKVESDARIRVRVAAVSSKIGVPSFHYHGELIRRGRSTCYPIFCPLPGGRVAFGVVTKNRRCMRRFFYKEAGASSFEDSENGLYTSLGSCQSGTDTAVAFSCRWLASKSSSIQTEEADDADPVDLDTDSIEEIRRLTEDDELVDMINNAGNSNSNTAAAAAGVASSEQRLVTLMEEVLEELKKDGNSEAPAGKAQAEAVPRDESLLSELDEVLKELE